MKSDTETPLVGIVDDEESVRTAISSLIRSVGYRAALFPSAEAFLSSGQVQQMDCLIIDNQMPALSGLELQRQLREADYAAPIIVISADNDELRATAINQGAAAVFAKPFSGEALLAAVGSAVRERSGH
jgi:FixJ family two-component response regulator